MKANKQNIKKYAKQLFGDDYSEPKVNNLINVCLNGFERTYGHISHDYAAHLEQIDQILPTFGVESIMKPDIHYCNTGDSYGLTIMYYRGKLIRASNFILLIRDREHITL